MSYAPSVIEPDMSNYYRLLRERLRREKLSTAFPGYTDKLDALYQSDPAVASFIQAIPTADLGPEHDDNSIQPGVVPRAINLSNSIIERKIFLKRIFEAAATGPEANSDRALATEQLETYCTALGLEPEMADRAVHKITHAAEKMARAKSFTVITGGIKP